MFNTIDYTRKLEEAGYSRKQAEVTVNMLLEFTLSSLATKSDFEGLKYSLKADFKSFKQSMKSDFEQHKLEARRDIKDLEYRLIIKLGAMQIVISGFMLAALKYLVVS